MNNKYYFLALNRMPSIGPRTVMKLLRRWPDLAELFKLSQIEMEEAGLPGKLAAILAGFDFSQVEQDLLWQQQNGNTLLTWADSAYPSLLRETADPPMVLYAQGDLASLEQPAVAMVGTRKPSISGSENAYRFAHELAKHDLTIVSGLALGIDARAHEGCLAAQGRTIAVMGTGIDYIYPHRHQNLALKIREKGLLLSEFPLKVRPNAGHFPRRNRIISGLSLCTLVIEAAIKSGSLITARLALEQNRDVLAIPGSIHNPQSRGCHHLLQQGAKLITSSHDVLDELNIAPIKADAGKEPVSLATNNKNLVKCVGFEVTTMDQILQRSGLSADEAACNLAELELQGIVQAVPGGYMRFI
ncbi:DNA-processing protein DprA [Legionella dresdenensis]|uniref:DNA-processing protein DprA n=1 Tax=Legionella dresdenensis TaxID=450200 RepID=A0ABV8CFT2_9GAMM